MIKCVIRAGAIVLMFASTSAWPASPDVAPSQPGRAPIVDQRAGFRAMFCALLRRDRPTAGADCNGWLRRFPDEGPASIPPALNEPPALNIVIVGGLFSDCLPAVPAFGDAAGQLRVRGYHVSQAPVKGRASADVNAAIIRAHVARERAAMPQLPLVIIAYSKGVTDTMTALAAYPELGTSVAGLISVAGVVNGSRSADQFVGLYNATAGLLPHDACPAGDGGELRSLTHEYRLDWLAKHRLPSGPLYFSIVGLPLPERVSTALSVFHRSLSRIDPRNDGQMIYSDAILPGSALLAYANADHFAIALPFDSAMPAVRLAGINRNDFPRAQLVEAAIRIAQARLGARSRP